jgi:hypothetical protein
MYSEAMRGLVETVRVNTESESVYTVYLKEGRSETSRVRLLVEVVRVCGGCQSACRGREMNIETVRMFVKSKIGQIQAV